MAVRGDTTGVRRGHEIDADALERYLAGHLDGFRGPVDVRQFEGGQSNPTYLIRASSGDYVLRKSRRASCCRRRTRSIASIE